MAKFSDRVLETGFFHNVSPSNAYDPHYIYQEEVGRPAKASSFRWYPIPHTIRGDDEYIKKWLFSWWTFKNKANLPARSNPDDYPNEDEKERAIGYFWGGNVGVGKEDEFIDNPNDMTLEGGESRVPMNMSQAKQFWKQMLMGGDVLGIKGEGYVPDAYEKTNLEATIESGPLMNDLMHLLSVKIDGTIADPNTIARTEPKEWFIFRQKLKVDSGEEFGLRILPFLGNTPLHSNDIIYAAQQAMQEGKRTGLIDIPTGTKAHDMISTFVTKNFNSATSGFASASEFVGKGFEVTMQEIKAKLAGVVNTSGIKTVTFTELSTIAQELETRLNSGVNAKTKGIAGQPSRRLKQGVSMYNFGAHTRGGYAILTLVHHANGWEVIPTHLSTGNSGPLIKQIMTDTKKNIDYNSFMKTVNALMTAGIYTFNNREMIMNFIGSGKVNKEYASGIVTRVSVIAPSDLAQRLRGIIDNTLAALADKMAISGAENRTGPFGEWVRKADMRGQAASWRAAKHTNSGWLRWLHELGGGRSAISPVDYVDEPTGMGYTSAGAGSEPPIKLRPFIWLHAAGIPQAVRGGSAKGDVGRIT